MKNFVTAATISVTQVKNKRILDSSHKQLNNAAVCQHMCTPVKNVLIKFVYLFIYYQKNRMQIN